MSCATAAMLAALGRSGSPTVVVAVAVTVSVVSTRVVENAVVVDSALVVTVLHISANDRLCSGRINHIVGVYSTTVVAGAKPNHSLQKVWMFPVGLLSKNSW
jgi:uncharacterized protein (DUF39 family)